MVHESRTRTTRMSRIHPTIEMNTSTTTTAAASSNGNNKNNNTTTGYLNLKPLRALDKNFDVDIAACLEEYLHELTLANPESFESNNHCSDDSVSRNPNQTAAAVAASATNFTNAAILLQNSSSVYSRKVEYLHSLVLQTFQRLSNDEEKQNNSTTNKKRLAAADKDPDIQDFEAFDPHWNFLVFQEDTLPVDLEGNLIDLESHDNGATSTMEMDLQHPHYTANAHTPLMNMNQTRLSLGAPPTGNFGSISKLDLNATMRSVTRNKSSIQSHAGQQMIRSILEGSQGRNAFMMNGSGNGGGEGQAVLRLMNGVCDVSESGALLLPGTGIASARAMASADDSFGNADNQQPLQGKLNMNMELEDHDDGGQFDQGYDDGGDDDHDNDGIGFELHSPSNGHIQLTARGYGNGDGPVGIHATARNMNMPTGNGNNHHDNDTKTQSCPWDLLDPHDASESKSRPLRAAITYRLPHGVDQPPSSIVTGTRTKNIPRAKNDEQSSNNEEYPLEYTCLAVQDYRAALKQMGSTHYAGQSMDTSMDSADTNIDFKERLIPLPIQPLVFGEEFLYVLKSQQRQRTAEKRRIRRLQRLQTQEISSSEAMDANERFDDMYDDNDDDNDGPAFELAGGDYDDGNDDDVNNAPDIFDQVFQQGENDNMECKTFEELCRAHLKEFAKGAERLAVETHLSKRVSIWQNKLEVILAEEEERHEFDIELYRSRIMTNVQDCLQKEHKSGEKGFPSDTIEFASITKEKEPFEVCRTFLASLMLCNSENVIFTSNNSNNSKNNSCNEMDYHQEAESDNVDVSSPHDLYLKMLKNDMASPLETYLAPSIASHLNRNQMNDAHHSTEMRA